MATAGDTRGLAGYRALVTGSTQGIGAAVAARLRKAGATVLITARKPPDALVSDDLFVAADVATVEGCAAVTSAVMEKLGGIDIVVHVVGVVEDVGGTLRPVIKTTVSAADVAPPVTCKLTN